MVNYSSLMTKGKIIIMAINFYRGITTEMYRVSKVLNNNGVIAIDMDENKEYVILGRVLALEKVSQRFDKPEGCTTYRLEQETERGSAKELVKGIEPEYLEIADAILTESQKVFGDSIDRGFFSTC